MAEKGDWPAAQTEGENLTGPPKHIGSACAGYSTIWSMPMDACNEGTFKPCHLLGALGNVYCDDKY